MTRPVRVARPILALLLALPLIGGAPAAWSLCLRACATPAAEPACCGEPDPAPCDGECPTRAFVEAADDAVPPTPDLALPPPAVATLASGAPAGEAGPAPAVPAVVRPPPTLVGLSCQLNC